MKNEVFPRSRILSSLLAIMTKLTNFNYSRVAKFKFAVIEVSRRESKVDREVFLYKNEEKSQEVFIGIRKALCYFILKTVDIFMYIND